MVKPSAEGAPSKLLTIDISQVATGGAPIFNTLAVTHTIIDGESQNGVPFMTFGAAIHDADGNLYVGGNGGDHDMNNGTHTSGAIYRVIVDETAGTAHLELVADAPRARSNDGAADPRAMDPFTQVDKSANILIRSPEVTPELPAAPEDGPLADTGYDDLVHGGAGKDTIYGDIGHDTLIGDTHGDTLLGEDGDDFIFGGAGPNWKDNGLISVYDDDGNRFDQFGNPLPEDDDMLFGGAGDDYLSGSAGHDTLDGGIGSDELSGGSGDDTLYGGVGDDTLSGGGHDDVLFGGEGNDLLHGGSGDNKLFGGVGDDEMLSGAGADYHDGGEGNDTMSGGNGNDELIGGRGNDVLRGGSDDDKLDGGAGDDKLDGGTGDDAMYGGAGNDSLKAGSGNDLLIGGEGNDYLAAWKGDDKLDGGAGNDRLYMGAGNDVASGGTGNDRFIYRADDLDGKRDTILDFRFDEHEQDTLDFRGLKLLDSGIDETTWRNNAVSRTDEKTVEVDLGQCTIELIDQFGAGDEFLNQVMDAVLFA
jgi:serralysin